MEYKLIVTKHSGEVAEGTIEAESLHEASEMASQQHDGAEYLSVTVSETLSEEAPKKRKA